jgi:4-hydroxythreonine-4-phosphate dehydrogenase
MKVYVTQGHEKGIGLEVFFKSCLMFSKEKISLIKLIAFKDSVKETLQSLQLPFKLEDEVIDLCGINIQVEWLKKVDHSESFTALEFGMKLSEGSGVLFTLPTSKDQFPGHPGHTEYFRAFYRRPELGMFFSSPKLKVLLLSDHVPVKELSKVITEDLIYKRLKTAVETLESWHWPTKRILVSGLNPHAGEKGLIGDEDERVTRAIKRLVPKLKLDMSGPMPGDTMLLEQKSYSDLLVYLFHDQGLGVFKGLQGFIGSNITLGLPYPRFSPDHGTSFGLFGKNQADYRGCAYALNEAVDLLKRISHGKNSGHQGQSSQS